MRSTILLGVAMAGAIGWVSLSDRPVSGREVQGDGFRCSVASITDGDSLRCNETEADGRQIRVRIAGIAAREHDGTCLPGHPCPVASAEASTAELARIAAGRILECQANGETYGRRAAFCTANGVDVSCAMIASGTAEIWPRYWRGHRC